MKKLWLALMLFVLAGSLASVSFAATEDKQAAVHWVSLKEGMAKAKAEKKPIIIDFFFGKGCPRCEVLERTVYNNPTIATKLNNEFVCVKVDLTKQLSPEEEKLGNQYDFKNDCLLLFLDHDGNVMKDPSGTRMCFIDAVDPEWFVKYLDMVRADYRR